MALSEGTKPLPEPMLTVLWHSLENNFAQNVQATGVCKEFDNYTLKWGLLKPRSLISTLVIFPILLSHWSRVTHICVSSLTIISSDNGWSAPSHYLNQCWNIVNWTLRNKLQWNFNRNSKHFHSRKCENIVCEMASILSRPQCVNFTHVWINMANHLRHIQTQFKRK